MKFGKRAGDGGRISDGRPSRTSGGDAREKAGLGDFFGEDRFAIRMRASLNFARDDDVECGVHHRGLATGVAGAHTDRRADDTDHLEARDWAVRVQGYSSCTRARRARGARSRVSPARAPRNPRDALFPRGTTSAARDATPGDFAFEARERARGRPGSRLTSARPNARPKRRTAPMRAHPVTAPATDATSRVRRRPARTPRNARFFIPVDSRRRGFPPRPSSAARAASSTPNPHDIDIAPLPPQVSRASVRARKPPTRASHPRSRHVHRFVPFLPLPRRTPRAALARVGPLRARALDDDDDDDARRQFARITRWSSRLTLARTLSVSRAGVPPISCVTRISGVCEARGFHAPRARRPSLRRRRRARGHPMPRERRTTPRRVRPTRRPRRTRRRGDVRRGDEQPAHVQPLLAQTGRGGAIRGGHRERERRHLGRGGDQTRARNPGRTPGNARVVQQHASVVHQDVSRVRV